MNKRWLWTFCTLLVCVLLPTIGQNSIVSPSLATAEDVVTLTPTNVDLKDTSGTFQDLAITNDIIYISDKTNKSIYGYDINSKSIITTITIDNIPDRLAYGYADYLVASNINNDQIIIFNSEQSQIHYYDSDGTLFHFQSIYDITQTRDGIIYALVMLEGQYRLIQADANNLTCNRLTTTDAQNASSRLAISLLGDTLLMLNNNKIYSYSFTDNNFVEDTTYKRPNTLNNVVSIEIDHKGEPYILCLDTTATTDGTTTYQYTLIHSTTNSYSTITFTSTVAITDFCLSPSNNAMYFLTSGQLLSLTDLTVDTVYVYNSENGNLESQTVESQTFLNPISATPHIDITTDTLTSPLQTATLNQDSYVYTYDNYLNKICKIKKDTNVVILDDQLDDTNDFCYIMNTTQQYNIVGYVLKSCITKLDETLATTTYTVLYANTKLYPFPTSLNNAETEEPRILTTLDKGFVFTSISSYATPTDYNNANFVFATITIDDKDYSGYIDQHCLAKIDNIQEITPVFVTNATTKDSTQVFTDNELSSQQTILPQGTAVQIVSTTNGISYIEWQTEGTTYYGYTKYSNLDDGSISTYQTIGFFVMLIALVACLIMLSVIKTHKRKYALDYEK